MAQPFRLESTGDDLLAHAVEQGESRSLAIGTQYFSERRFERGLGDDFRLDSGREPFGPRFAVALHRGQALFFPDQCVDLVCRLLLEKKKITIWFVS